MRQEKAMRILMATDLLPKSEAAIERAGMMAEGMAADLSLLHVVVPSASERALEQDLKHAIARLRSRSKPPLWSQGASPSVIVKAGSPANRIIETIDEVSAELIVLGPHRRRPARDVLRGTIAEKVLTARNAPVLFVKRAPRAAYRKVLVALDLSEISGHALRATESLVMTPDTHAAIVHAYEPYYEGTIAYAGVGREAIEAYGQAWARNAETAVRDLLRQHTADFTRYSIVMQHARAPAGILKVADRLQSDLLVMGTRGHGRLRRALVGSVANEVLGATTCDVLIVPDGSLRTSEHRSPQTARARRREPFNEIIPGA
jgi:universal stress protein E